MHKPRLTNLKPHSFLALSFGAILILPCFFVVVKALDTSAEQLNLWKHLIENTLPGYMRTTCALLAGVVPLTAVIGTSAAWVCARYDFPLRRWLQLALLLPLALPTYLLAYAVADAFQFVIPGVRSVQTAVLLFAFTLFPYVYVPAYTAFREAGVTHFDAARTMGYGPRAAFFRAALPGCLNAVLSGSAFVAMETAADFGTSEHFALDTLAVGVYRTWFGHGSLDGAAQVAVLLLCITGFFLWAHNALLSKGSRARTRGRGAERQNPEGAHEHDQQLSVQTSTRIRASGLKAFACMGVCAVPVGIGFALPLLILLQAWLGSSSQALGARRLFELSLRSLTISGLAALACTAAAILMISSTSQHKGHFGRRSFAFLKLLKGGYALPGTVLAVGVLLTAEWISRLLPDELAPALIGTAALLIYAHTCRYTSLPLDQILRAVERVPSHLTEAARTLGASRLVAFRRVTLPVLRPTVLSACALVFVDVLKELPTNMLLAPFDFETLPVVTYNLASDERLGAAAPAALLIVGVGLLPVALLVKAAGLLRP